MADLIHYKVASYLDTLTATNEICSTLGTLLSFGTNLFVAYEPDLNHDIVNLVPYSGGEPNMDGHRQSPSVQIRLRTNNRQRGFKSQQSIINHMHMNSFGGNGMMYAVNSAPMITEVLEGGEWVIIVSNFDIKHVKV